MTRPAVQSLLCAESKPWRQDCLAFQSQTLPRRDETQFPENYKRRVSKTPPSDLSASEIALDDWQENTRKWESISGDRFNVSMKKALFLDKSPSSERAPLQMHNLDTFEAMTAATLQFLQHNAQYPAGVTITKKGKGYKGKGKSNTDGLKTVCFVCGGVGPTAKDTQQQGQERRRRQRSGTKDPSANPKTGTLRT